MSTASVNEVRLIGNLGADPEFKTTPSGGVATLSLATTYRRGETEKTEWHRVVLWKAAAERAEKYLRKGASVYVQGRLQTRRWTDAQGVDRWITEVVGEHFQMLGSKKGDVSDSQQSSTPPKAAVPDPSDDDLERDDSIPF